MDITVNNKKRFSNSIMNGETVNYTISSLFSFFLLIAVKQLCKTFLGIDETAACLIGFGAAEICCFFLLKFFVFGKNALSGTIKQILLSVINAGVHLGIYAVVSLAFKSLGLFDFSAWFMSFVIIFILNYAVARILVFDCLKKSSEFLNGRVYKKFFSNRFIILSMALTAVIIMFIYAIFSVFPFGDTTVLRMDLYHQYGPLFVELFDRVTQSKSFIYSWTTGGGSSFLGNYFNYLSSPFSALIFLFDRKDMPFAISAIVALKAVASSGSFAFYIKKSLNRHSAASSVFGLFYAFSAYFLAYFWNIMWLDGMIILPLLVLGIERIIKTGKTGLYVFSLIYILYSNYYIGYMLCIFSVIYFIAYFIMQGSSTYISNEYSEDKLSLRKIFDIRFINRGFRFAFASIFAVCVCAAVLFPVAGILSGSSATSDNMPSEFNIYYTLFDFIQTHLANLETTIRSSGEDVLPNVYCSVLTLVLVPLFILNKNISLREKSVYTVLIAIFLLSFNINYANFIWHAFHFPNDLPYRFSFMYSFILLVIAFRALMNIKALGIREIGIIGIIWVGFIAISNELPTQKINNLTIYTSLAFTIAWVGLLFAIKKKSVSKLIASVLIIAVAACEVLISSPMAFRFNQEHSLYVENYDKYRDAIEYIEKNDKSDYRLELCSLNTRMDNCLYGYNGMSIFSSMAYENYSRLQYSLGMFGNRINSYTYNTQTPVYNMMYNIKYLIYNNQNIRPSTDLYTKCYETDSEDGAVVFENDYTLSKVFCVNPNIDSWDTAEGNPFKIQQDFFSHATGYLNVFTEAEFTNSSYTGITGEELSQGGNVWLNKAEENSYATADFTFKAKESGNIYLYVSSRDINNITVTHNEDSSTFVIETPYIIDLGYAEIGDSLTASLDCTSLHTGETGIEIYAYSLNKTVLEKGYRKLKNGEMTVSECTDTTLKGTISADTNSYVYSSIPYDSGWKVYIDGEKAEIFEIGKCQLGVMIKPGTHTIEYVYSPKGLNAGIAVSSASLLFAAGYFCFTFIKRKKCTNNDKLVKS